MLMPSPPHGFRDSDLISLGWVLGIRVLKCFLGEFDRQPSLTTTEITNVGKHHLNALLLTSLQQILS